MERSGLCPEDFWSGIADQGPALMQHEVRVPRIDLRIEKVNQDTQRRLPMGKALHMESLSPGGNLRTAEMRPTDYLGGAGVKISRLRPGSGFGLGFGAFLASFLPLSLLPMRQSMT